MNRYALGGVCAAVSIVIAGCSQQPVQQQVVAGECQPAYGANLCTWAEMAGDQLVAWGVTVPLAAIEGAPADAEMTWPPTRTALIALPQQVTAANGLRNLTFFWEPHGHPPGPYLTPHFDFHFNALSAEEIAALDCSDLSKPDAIPDGYALPDIDIPELGMLTGLCVPMMGMHALPASELEGDEPFEKTMIIGYYGAKPIFVEPMIARAPLVARQDFTMDVPAVPGNPDGGLRFPRLMQAAYDAETDAYRFRFSD